ncbi:hypothetical protein ACHAQE_010830 [Botrytis cinerea]
MSEIISFDNLDTYPKSEYIAGLEKATNLLFWVVDEELDRCFTGTYMYKDKLEGIGVYALARLVNSEKGYRHNEGIWKVLPFKGVRSGEVGEDIGKTEKEAAVVFSILQSMFAISSKNEAGTTTLHAYIPERDGIKAPFASSLVNPGRAAIIRVQSALATVLISCRCIRGNAHPKHEPNPHFHANPYRYVELNKDEEGRNSVFSKLEEL